MVADPRFSDPRSEEPEPRPRGDGVEQIPLPVLLAVDGGLEPALRAWMEASPGLQPVDAATASVLPPVAALADGRTPVPDGLPTVLLVTQGMDALAAGRAAANVGAVEVVRWPEAREEIADLVARIGTAGPASSEAVSEVAIGGTAGGVGTTTVALAIGGLVAWAHRPTLLLAAGHVPGVREIWPMDAVTGARTWVNAHPAAGVPRLRVVRTDHPPTGPVDPGEARTLIRDVGVAADVDVLVGRGDGALEGMLERTTAGLVVLQRGGPLPASRLRRLLADRPHVEVDWSQRVARAAVTGRVPASLPGRWLDALRPVARRLAG